MQVALLGWLSFVVFVLPRKDLATRLGVVVSAGRYPAGTALLRCQPARRAAGVRAQTDSWL